jgi:hypothetical protein
MKTGQVFFRNENDELYLAESFEDENENVTTTHTKIEQHE